MWRYFVARYLVLFLCFSISGFAKSQLLLNKSDIQAVLSHPKRWNHDHKDDANRRPGKILAFMRIAKGDRVLDIYAGGGWYSELFSMAVGVNGKVFAQNDQLTWRFGGHELSKRTESNRLSNLVRLDQVSIADIDLPGQSIDIAFMGINYHDLFFTDRIRNGKKEIMRNSIVDYRKSFLNVKRLLKDDGVLIITDHYASAGSGYEAANKLHRIDPNIVKYQLNQLGFVLAEEAFYLRNPDDDLSKLVFSEDIRGRTDRFIYKFIKK